jgi:hypothetical protein
MEHNLLEDLNPLLLTSVGELPSYYPWAYAWAALSFCPIMVDTFADRQPKKATKTSSFFTFQILGQV